VAPPPFELGGNDPRVVEHQHVAAPQQPRQVGHGTIGDVFAGHREQPRRIARAGGPQRDPLCGKVEVEQINAHGVVSDHPGLAEGRAWKRP